MDFPRVPYKVLFDQKLAATQATFDVQNIDQTYGHLQFILNSRDSHVIVESTGNLIFNNDTGVNYYSVAFSGLLSTSSNFLFESAGSNAGANIFGFMQGYIPDYSSTSGVKNVYIEKGVLPNLASTVTWIDNPLRGVWNSTAAINRLTFTPGGGVWSIGSRLTIIGYGFAA